MTPTDHRSGNRRLTAACISVGAAGVGALVVTVLRTHRPFDDAALFGFFFAILTLTYVRPLRLWHEGQAEHLSLDEALVVPMVLLLTPVETMLAVGLSAFIGQLARRAHRTKMVFNVGQTMTSAGLALAVSRLLGASTGHATSMRALVAAFLGGLAFDAFTTTAVAWIISLAQRVAFLPILTDGGVVRAATYVGSLSLGVLVALAAASHHLVLGVVIVPVAVLHFAYAAALGQWRERRRTEDLYRAARSFQDTMDSEQVRTRLVTSVRDLLGAERAVLVPASESDRATDDGSVLRVPLDDELAVVVDSRVGGGKWDSSDLDVLRALVGVATGALRNATLYEQLRVITSSLGEGVFAVDRDGITGFMNPAAVLALGWTEDDLIGHRLDERLGGGEPGRVSAVSSVLLRGETVVD